MNNIGKLEKIIEKARSLITEVSSKEVQEHEIKIIGTRSGDVRKIFSDLDKEDIKNLSDREKTDLSMKFLLDEFEEMKFFGNLCVGKYFKSIKDEDYELVKDTLEKGLNWWCNADRFASSLSKRIKSNRTTVDWLVKWSECDKLWLQRVSCVSFVPIAKYGEYNDVIIKICSNVVKNNERFAQLGVGWLLRELSLADLKLTKSFIKDNYNYFIKEGLRYATEKMKESDKKSIMNYKPKDKEEDVENDEEEKDEKPVKRKSSTKAKSKTSKKAKK